VGDEHEDRVPPRERAVGLAVAAVVEDVGGGSGGAVVVGDEDAGGLAREGSLVERGGVLFVGDRGAAVLRESCLVLFEQHGEGGVSLGREESEPLRFTTDECCGRLWPRRGAALPNVETRTTLLGVRTAVQAGTGTVW